MADDDDGLFQLDAGVATGDRSPQESGTTQWQLNEAVPTSFDLRDASQYQPKRLLARLAQGKPQNVSLHIRAAGPADSPFDFDAMANFPVLGGADAIGVVLIIDYGDMSGNHRVVADCRSGTYLLPAITFAQVYALTWAEPGTINFAFSVSAALSRATPSNPKKLSYTGAGLIEASGSRFVPVPYYAQWVDIWANGWAGGIGAADAPNLLASEVGLYRDYTSGLFVPPFGPISLSGDALDNDALTLENAGPTEVRCFCQFYLEL